MLENLPQNHSKILRLYLIKNSLNAQEYTKGLRGQQCVIKIRHVAWRRVGSKRGFI